MKKIFFFAALAAVALASCSSDETTAVNETAMDANTISFRPLLNGLTRATTGPLTAFATNDVLDVWAAYYDGSSTTKYFQDNFTFTAGQGFYSDPNRHYWPDLTSSKTLTFTAVYGATGTQSAAGTFTHTPNTTASSQTDVLLAQAVANSSTEKSAKFVLNFRHALSQIVVKAKNTNANLKLTISGVRVGYVDQSGTLTYAGGATTTHQSSTGSVDDGVTLITGWSNTAATGADANKYDQNLSSDLVLDGTASATELTGVSSWLLLPQTLKNHTDANSDDVYEYSTTENGSASGAPKLTGAYLALEMKIETKDGAGSTLVSKQWCYWPITTNWLAGKKYTYTIDAGNGGYQPQDINNDGKYDPILGDYIVFSPSCTVDAWIEADGTIVSAP